MRVLLAFREGWVFLLLFYVPLMLAMVAHMGCAWLYLPQGRWLEVAPAL